MFKLNKNKNKKYKHSEKDVSNMSSTKIKIKVFKSMGGNIDACRAEYTAIEQRNDFGELVSINSKIGHEEDVDFIKDNIYREMKILLRLRNKTPKQQKEELDKKIEKQERLIFYLDRVVELNALYNYQDEWSKLKDYRVLRDNLKLDEQGSYFYVENGIRVYEFISSDGFFIPIWRGSLTYSSYPDHTLRKKIKIREDMKFLQEISGHRLSPKLMSYSLIFFIINILLLGGMGYGYVKLYEMNKGSAVVQAEQQCMQNSVDINNKLSKVYMNAMDLQEYLLVMKKQSINQSNNENFIKDLTPS